MRVVVAGGSGKIDGRIVPGRRPTQRPRPGAGEGLQALQQIKFTSGA